MAVKIELRAYDPEWAAAFARVRDLIRGALGPAALAIEHVGSTAVPGLSAKPIIDVVLVVDDSSRELDYVPRLGEAGFTLHVREPEWHQHRVLKLAEPAVNLHVFSLGCPEVARMVAFRDLLRRDEPARAVYLARKQELAERAWDRVQDYADQKTGVVNRLLDGAGGREDGTVEDGAEAGPS